MPLTYSSSSSSILTVVLISLILGCSQPLRIEGFDGEQWEADKYGCNGQRVPFAALIDENRDYLLGRDQNELEALLGLPDEHELDSRRKKFFNYYLEPGAPCEDGLTYPIKLQIKFNALGLSSEVFLENYSGN